MSLDHRVPQESTFPLLQNPSGIIADPLKPKIASQKNIPINGKTSFILILSSLVGSFMLVNLWLNFDYLGILPLTKYNFAIKSYFRMSCAFTKNIRASPFF